MSEEILVYGATGLSGSLTVEALLSRGIRPVLGGRDRASLRSLSERFGLRYSCFSLNSAQEIAGGIRGFALVCNSAGPFIDTALPLAQACIAKGIHYLDLCGEALPIERLAHHGADARRANCMVMPGIGFDVVPSDCVILRLARKLPSATRVALGVSLPSRVTLGSHRSFLGYARERVFVRRHGSLVPVAIGTLERAFDYGAGPRRSCAIAWGDTSTAYYTTGIPNVTTFLETTALLRTAFYNIAPFQMMNASPVLRALWDSGAELALSGPSSADRMSARATLVAELEDDEGNCVSARITTPEPYAFTATTASQILDLVQRGDFEPGFQTPARVYGPELLSSFSGIELDAD